MLIMKGQFRGLQKRKKEKKKKKKGQFQTKLKFLKKYRFLQ